MNLTDIKTVYFIGIGGIGMSAIARYFLSRGMYVHGYDKTETELTQKLAEEGMEIHYADDISFIPEKVDLVVYTPAVPKNHSELCWFQERNYPVKKRSEVLGIISRGMRTFAVAGTHGKTTTSSILTHILRVANLDNTAFLGGIACNYNSNYVEGHSNIVVVEADEFDRSFLQLNPDIALLMSMDADHLDIYGDADHVEEGYTLFAQRIKKGGKLIYRHGLPKKLIENLPKEVENETFGIGIGVYKATNLKVEDGLFAFDILSPLGNIDNIRFALPGKHNVENATAAAAAAQQVGVSPDIIREALATFKGIKRRFEFIVRTPEVVYIDDYAHHPTELKSAIEAARMLYPDKKILGVFQPHLYSRTRDFVDGFAEALDALDEVLLMDIYPARELPIEGVTNEIIFHKMLLSQKEMVTKQNLMDIIKLKKIDVILTLGAGDIDTFVPKIKELLHEKFDN